MRKIFLLFVISLLSISAQAQFKNPSFMLAYPEESGVIRDQSQVATVAMSATIGLTVDGRYIIGVAGKENPEIRTQGFGWIKPRVIDLLPGKYTFALEYENIVASGQFHKTTEPVEMEVDLKAGTVYWITAITRSPEDGSSKGNIMFVLNDSYLSEKQRRSIIEARNRNFR
jgi:hypothetical protein